MKRHLAAVKVRLKSGRRSVNVSGGSTKKTGKKTGTPDPPPSPPAIDPAQAKRDAAKVRAAIVRLGLDYRDIERLPPLGAMMAESFGGLAQAIQALRFSPHPAVEAFLAVYDQLDDEDRDWTPWEAIATKAERRIVPLMNAMITALRDHSVARVKIIAVTAHPELIKKRIQRAQERDGYRDRNALDTALKFLPSQKGITIINAPSQQTTITASEDAGEPDLIEAPDDIDLDETMPTLTETQKMIGSGEEL